MSNLVNTLRTHTLPVSKTFLGIITRFERLLLSMIQSVLEMTETVLTALVTNWTLTDQ